MIGTLRDEVLFRLPAEVSFVNLQGHRVILRMKEPMLTAVRGHMLLELEKRLHREVDVDLEALLEPMADKNKPRIKLRGVAIQ